MEINKTKANKVRTSEHNTRDDLVSAYLFNCLASFK